MCQLWTNASGCPEPWVESDKPVCVWIREKRILWPLLPWMPHRGSGGIALYKWLKCSIRGDTFVLSVIQGLSKACDNTFFFQTQEVLCFPRFICHIDWQDVWEALWRPWYTAQTAPHTEGQAVGRALASAVSVIWMRYLSFCPQRVKCNFDYAIAIGPCYVK